MLMTEYIQEIQRRFVTEYGFTENPDKPGLPMNVSDGEYPMRINGKIDEVRVKNGKIFCCVFDEEKSKSDVEICVCGHSKKKHFKQECSKCWTCKQFEPDQTTVEK